MPASAQNEQAGGHRRRTGSYVYGVVPQDVELAEETRGVGDPPGVVRIVREGDLAALVSEVDLTRPLGTPEDLVAHQQLLDATAGEVPVLPMRFGAVMDSPEAVAQELLAAHQDEFAAALRDLEGHAEYVVRGRYLEEPLLTGILSSEPEAAQLAAEIRGKEEALTRDARIRLGEIITDQIATRREADTRAVTEAVDGACVASVVRDPSHEEDAVNIALLVSETRRDALAEAVESIASEWEGHTEIRLLGPLAPYDFVGPRQPES